MSVLSLSLSFRFFFFLFLVCMQYTQMNNAACTFASQSATLASASSNGGDDSASLAFARNNGGDNSTSLASANSGVSLHRARVIGGSRRSDGVRVYKSTGLGTSLNLNGFSRRRSNRDKFNELRKKLNDEKLNAFIDDLFKAHNPHDLKAAETLPRSPRRTAEETSARFNQYFEALRFVYFIIIIFFFCAVSHAALLPDQPTFQNVAF
jgi:hypothetical protein